jgi:hypothetical protein
MRASFDKPSLIRGELSFGKTRSLQELGISLSSAADVERYPLAEQNDKISMMMKSLFPSEEVEIDMQDRVNHQLYKRIHDLRQDLKLDPSSRLDPSNGLDISDDMTPFKGRIALQRYNLLFRLQTRQADFSEDTNMAPTWRGFNSRIGVSSYSASVK